MKKIVSIGKDSSLYVSFKEMGHIANRIQRISENQGVQAQWVWAQEKLSILDIINQSKTVNVAQTAQVMYNDPLLSSIPRSNRTSFLISKLCRTQQKAKQQYVYLETQSKGNGLGMVFRLFNTHPIFKRSVFIHDHFKNLLTQGITAHSEHLKLWLRRYQDGVGVMHGLIVTGCLEWMSPRFMGKLSYPSVVGLCDLAESTPTPFLNLRRDVLTLSEQNQLSEIDRARAQREKDIQTASIRNLVKRCLVFIFLASLSCSGDLKSIALNTMRFLANEYVIAPLARRAITSVTKPFDQQLNTVFSKPLKDTAYYLLTIYSSVLIAQFISMSVRSSVQFSERVATYRESCNILNLKGRFDTHQLGKQYRHMVRRVHPNYRPSEFSFNLYRSEVSSQMAEARTYLKSFSYCPESSTKMWWWAYLYNFFLRS